MGVGTGARALLLHSRKWFNTLLSLTSPPVQYKEKTAVCYQGSIYSNRTVIIACTVDIGKL